MMRYYALSGIGAVTATLLLIPEIDGKITETRRAVLYTIALIVAFASSYITLFILPAHLIYILRKPRGKRLLSVGFISALVLSIPMLFLILKQISNQGLPFQPGNLIDFVAGAIARLAFTVYSFSFGEFIRPVGTPLRSPRSSASPGLWHYHGNFAKPKSEASSGSRSEPLYH